MENTKLMIAKLKMLYQGLSYQMTSEAIKPLGKAIDKLMKIEKLVEKNEGFHNGTIKELKRILEDD